ncbi:MAG: ferredoxin [Methanomassiliicoccales archaeon PtaU1.Bin124]|nr:MAG: ferredoxin [Methanomassiliicoccales archaeon PtaU1.Bin124]
MVKRKIIEIDESLCTGCGNCVTACAEGAMELRDGKAKVVKESFCDGLGACIGECPAGALKIVEREAEDFSEEDVKEHLARRSCDDIPIQACPGSGPRKFHSGPKGEAGGGSSQLSTWPIQIRLVPPNAPYLRNARLLIAADCTAFACGFIQRDFIKDRVVLIGCPKLDDNQEFVDKLTTIFRVNEIKDVILLHMDVPCCRVSKKLVHMAIERSGKTIPMEEFMVYADGGRVKKLS